jgi:hypothetical protein
VPQPGTVSVSYHYYCIFSDSEGEAESIPNFVTIVQLELMGKLNDGDDSTGSALFSLLSRFNYPRSMWSLRKCTEQEMQGS